MKVLIYFLKPLTETVLLEETGALAIGIREKQDLLLVLLVNILTNPAVVLISHFLHLYLPPVSAWMVILAVVEPLAVIVEYGCYRKYLCASVSPLKTAAILNVLSLFGGFVLLCLKHL